MNSARLRIYCSCLALLFATSCSADAPTALPRSGGHAAPAQASLQLPAAVAGKVVLVGEDWLSSPRNDYNLSVDADERMLVFARSDADFKDAHIWMARPGRSTPVEVPFSDSRYKDSDPWLSPDGRMLYFVSNRPVPGTALANGSLDIWRVSVTEDGFGALEHLSGVSSPKDELGPEMHEGWLYFNSSREGGPAKMELYRARVSGNAFDAPTALSAPFNDGRIQGDFTLSPDGRLALFWSQRGGTSGLDLFVTCRTSSSWATPVRLPPPISNAAMSFTPAFSADGCRSKGCRSADEWPVQPLCRAGRSGTRRSGGCLRCLTGSVGAYAHWSDCYWRRPCLRPRVNLPCEWMGSSMRTCGYRRGCLMTSG